MTIQNQLGQILEDNKACRKPGCPCCAHWNVTLYNLLTLLGTVLDALEMTATARNRLLQEIADLKRRLLLFDNPNTPSSQKSISQKKRSNQNNPDDAITKKLPAPSRGIRKPGRDFRLRGRNITSASSVRDAMEKI